MKKIALTFFVFYAVMFWSCEEPETGNTVTTTCIDHLKGQRFELYQYDTQSFYFSNDKPAGLKGTIGISSTSGDYLVYVYNAKGDSVTKVNGSFAFPTRSFRILGGFVYYGDDKGIIVNCSQGVFNFAEIDQGTRPDIYLKITAYTRPL